MEESSTYKKTNRHQLQVTSIEPRPRESEDRIIDEGTTFLTHRFSAAVIEMPKPIVTKKAL